VAHNDEYGDVKVPKQNILNSFIREKDAICQWDETDNFLSRH